MTFCPSNKNCLLIRFFFRRMLEVRNIIINYRLRGQVRGSAFSPFSPFKSLSVTDSSFPFICEAGKTLHDKVARDIIQKWIGLEGRVLSRETFSDCHPARSQNVSWCSTHTLLPCEALSGKRELSASRGTGTTSILWQCHVWVQQLAWIFHGSLRTTA